MTDSGSGYHIQPDEVRKGGDQLGDLSDRVRGHGEGTSDALSRISSRSSRDTTGVGGTIVRAVEGVAGIAGKFTKEAERVLRKSREHLHGTADTVEENERTISDRFGKIHHGEDTPHPSSQGSPERTTAQSTPAVHENRQPPSSTGEHSDDFTKQPNLEEPHPYTKQMGNSDRNPWKLPPDKSRGAQIEQLDESRVTRQNGLITHVDGKPVKDYLAEVSTRKSHESRHAHEQWKNETGAKKLPRERPSQEKTCSAVAIDRRTGLITHGVNGDATHVIPDNRLHPLLQSNYQDMRAWKHEGRVNENGTQEIRDGQAHPSNPNQHAEVKAVNELLWQRQAANPGQPLHPDILGELGFDARKGQPVTGEAFPACANCHTILRGVPSNTGRLPYEHGHPNFEGSQIGPEL